MSTVAAPVVASNVPLASVAMTLMRQSARLGYTGSWTASGGPKKQFSTGWHAFESVKLTGQSAYVVQLGCGAFALTQCLLVVDAPLVQSRLPVPLLATRFPGVIMSRSKK